MRSVVAAALVLCLAAGARGDEWADGLRAYDAGDYAAAHALWRRAAAAGHTGAMTAIAGAYAAGEGVPADAKQAAAWYRRAAELGVRSPR